MMSKWTENIGTPEYPVSYLHEYAVALIWDRLNAGGCFVKTTSNEYEHVTVPNGGRIGIPDELTPIAGMMPDIAIYDADHRPVTVVEVQVTSAPSENKMARLDRLGVKMIVVPVPNEEALFTMFQPVSTEELFPSINIPDHYYGHTNLIKSRRRIRSSRHLDDANHAVSNLIRYLKMCDPALRKELRTVLDELDSIESQYPILPGNPKLPKLPELEEESAEIA